MKAHIVFAHPNLNSLNGQLRNVAIQTLERHGWEVTTSDLYQMDFKATANHQDFKKIQNPAYFDLQSEQEHAAQKGTFSDDILQEQALLDDADAIIFQFPLWWESVPALIKGYFDRVFAYGWAYGRQYALMGKTTMVCTTTGAPGVTWKPGNRGALKDALKPILKGTLEFCGLKVLPLFVVYGAKTKTEEEKLAAFTLYASTIEGYLDRIPKP
jgi:NAD(P)H dehydrogenase (quinone)